MDEVAHLGNNRAVYMITRDFPNYFSSTIEGAFAFDFHSEIRTDKNHDQEPNVLPTTWYILCKYSLILASN